MKAHRYSVMTVMADAPFWVQNRLYVEGKFMLGYGISGVDFYLEGGDETLQQRFSEDGQQSSFRHLREFDIEPEVVEQMMTLGRNLDNARRMIHDSSSGLLGTIAVHAPGTAS